MKKQQYILGSFCILIVNILWLLSAFFTQAFLLSENDSAKPFLITFYCNALFTLNLIFYLPLLWNHCTTARDINVGYRRLGAEPRPTEGSKEKSVTNLMDVPLEVQVNWDINRTEVNTTESLVSNRQLSIQSGACQDKKRLPGEVTDEITCCFFFMVKQSTSRISIKETFKLGAICCPIWFLMNYSYNRSLMGTSLGSNDTLSTLGGPLCIILSRVFLKEPLVLINIIGVAVMISGTVLIILNNPNIESDYIGDLWAILSAFVFACNSILIKFCVDDGSKISMSLLFGFIGAGTIFFLWPLFFFFNYTKIEPITLPNFDQFRLMTLIGLCNVVSDYFMARAIVFTTPLVTSVGLCLGIPASVLVDVLINREDKLVEYIVGVMCVVIGFLVVNLQVALSLEQEEQQPSMVIAYGGGVNKRLLYLLTSIT